MINALRRQRAALQQLAQEEWPSTEARIARPAGDAAEANEEAVSEWRDQ